MIERIRMTSLLFSVLVGLLLGLDYLQLTLNPPLGNSALQSVLQALDENKNQEDLRDAYRTLQFQARKAFFTLQNQVQTGRYLLSISLGVFFLTYQLPRTKRKNLTTPQPRNHIKENSKKDYQMAPFLLWGMVFSLGGLVLSFMPPLGSGKTLREALTLEQERQGNWSALRGNAGGEIQNASNLPLRWNGTTGENVLWKVAPGKPGFSSPVLWGDDLFLAGGDTQSFEARCYNATTGNLKWTTVLKQETELQNLPKVSDNTGYSASTPASDKSGYYVIFATGDLFALNFEGQIRWKKSLGLPENLYGHASSLITYSGLVFVQYDHEVQSRILAFDTQTGDQVWSQDRSAQVKSSWSSPILAQEGKTVSLVVNGLPFLMAYNPLTGEKLWEQECLGGEVAPSSTYGQGRVFAANEYASLTAVDLKTGQVLWVDEEGPLPDVSSPVAAGDYLFLASGYGAFSLFDGATGQKYWTLEKGAGAYSSPLYLGGLIYLFDKDGVCFVVKPGPDPEILAENPLNEPIMTTPVVYKNSLIFRGKTFLYSLGRKKNE